jgi:uncharacterized protein YjbJ (UPF0337 family)
MMSEHQTSGSHPRGLFETVAAKAKKAVGRLTGNNDLAREGELQEVKVEAASEAARRAADAEQRRRETDVAADLEANRVEQQRVGAELLVAERDAQIEREHKAEHAAADHEFNRRSAEVRDRARRDDETIRQEERVTADTRLDGALDAVAVAQEASRAEASADALHTARHELEREQTGE